MCSEKSLEVKQVWYESGLSKPKTYLSGTWVPAPMISELQQAEHLMSHSNAAVGLIRPNGQRGDWKSLHLVWK